MLNKVYLEKQDDLNNPLEDSQKLWRYMNLPKFVSLLETKSLWLARADTFEDKHEGLFPDEMKRLTDLAYEKFSKENTELNIKDSADFQDYLKKNNFISCWHKNFDENMIMWLLYGEKDNGVAVQTTVEAIKNNTNTLNITGISLIIGNVLYKNSNEITEILNYEDCFFRKRRHFSFEQEVRISLDTYDCLNPSKNTKYGYYLPLLSIEDFIDKVLIHPDSSPWFKEVVESIIKKYELHVPIEKGNCGFT